METFTCDSCFKVFSHKGNYNAHLRRLTPCGPSHVPIAKTEPNECACTGCFKVFANKSNRVKHETKTACALKIQQMKDEASQLKEVLEKNKDICKMGEFLEYGNVIKIISSDSVYDNKYFFVERLYDNKLVLISDKETITLGITDQILDDTSISEIIIVYKLFNLL